MTELRKYEPFWIKLKEEAILKFEEREASEIVIRISWRMYDTVKRMLSKEKDRDVEFKEFCMQELGYKLELHFRALPGAIKISLYHPVASVERATVIGLDDMLCVEAAQVEPISVEDMTPSIGLNIVDPLEKILLGDSDE